MEYPVKESLDKTWVIRFILFEHTAGNRVYNRFKGRREVRPRGVTGVLTNFDCIPYEPTIR
jgi:hypothetical protein